MKSIKKIISLFCLTAFISCCGDDPVTSGNDVKFPEENVSYYEHVHPYMKLTCAYVGCHHSSTQAGNISLESHIDLMRYPLFVMPGEPEKSYLVWKLNGSSPFRAFCYQGYVEESVVKGISKWIEEGAKAN